MRRISKNTSSDKSRRLISIMLAACMLMPLLSGCMASAATANLMSEEERARYAALSVASSVAPSVAPSVVDITPSPTDTPEAAAWAALTASPALLSPSPTLTPTPTPTASPTAPPTPSPSPTASPSPTPEYTVQEIDDKKAYLNAGSANLRKGPGTDYKIILELEENTELVVTGESGDWFRVKAEGERGYVLAEFVEFGSPPTPEPTKTPRPTASPTPKPTASPTPEPTKAPEPTERPSSDGSSYFSDANGYTADELMLIAQVVYEEAKGSDVEALAAVANVIYNRLQSSKFPNSVDGVIFQKYQFTVADDDIYSVTPGSKAVTAVKQIFVEGNMPLPENIMYFRAARKGTSWSGFTYYDTIGGNSFFYR